MIHKNAQIQTRFATELNISLSILCIAHCLIGCDRVSLVPVALCSILITKSYKPLVLMLSSYGPLFWFVFLHKTIYSWMCSWLYFIFCSSVFYYLFFYMFYHFSFSLQLKLYFSNLAHSKSTAVRKLLNTYLLELF